MRVFGLDIVRAVAVLSVLWGHTLAHSVIPDWLRTFHRVGSLGVELFFVLSGFLIGGIIVEQIASGRFESAADLLRFWSRRWLRTLPLYYFFLIVYLKYDWRGPTNIQAHWEYLVFLQNFAWPCPDFFVISWSLTIEEYFYLLFPIGHYLLHRLLHDPMRCLKLSVAIFISVPLVLKIHRSAVHDWDGFNGLVRGQTITRLDSLMYGVAMAVVKRQRPLLWQRLAERVALPFAALLAIVVYFYYGLPGLMEYRALRFMLYPVVSLCLALLLPRFDGIRGGQSSFLQRAVTHTSLVSYSLYLGHPLIITLVNRELPRFGLGRVYQTPSLLYPLYFTAFFLLATATYYLVELPFMRLRK